MDIEPLPDRMPVNVLIKSLKTINCFNISKKLIIPILLLCRKSKQSPNRLWKNSVALKDTSLTTIHLVDGKEDQ